MIDTIHFRINTSGNSGLFYLLHNYLKEHRGINNVPISPYLKVNVVDYGNTQITNSRGFINIPSSNYDISVNFQKDKNYVDFNVSIPKFYFGHNVGQYILSPIDADFSFLYADINKQKNVSYMLLLRFFDDFIKYVLNGLVSRFDIQIRRIDFCYNLIFSTPEDLDLYYEKLKTIRMKYLRTSSNKLSSYQTSFSYVGKGYSFKVYKKGAEFEKNDARHLDKFNEEKNALHFNVPQLKNLAFRTLRYEITMRKEFMSRLYRDNWYRKDCPLWNSIKAGFNEDSLGNKKKINFEYLKIFKKAKNKSVDFYLDVSKNVTASNSYYDGEVLHLAKFSGLFYDYLLDYFWQKVNEYKLTTIDYNILEKSLLKKGNEKIFSRIKRLNDSPLSLDELYHSGILPKSTYYKYKKLLKESGFNSHSLKQSINVFWNYERYFIEMTTNGLLKKLKKFS